MLKGCHKLNSSSEKTITCPICGLETKAKLSGKGKHYVYFCKEHGPIKIIKNPILGV
jgi:YHS domain-containing protein